MSNPLFDDDDFPIPVTRMVFEPIADSGQVRWTAWSEDKLLLAMTADAGRPDELRKLLETTRILSTAVAAARPAGPRRPASAG